MKDIKWAEERKKVSIYCHKHDYFLAESKQLTKTNMFTNKRGVMFNQTQF